MNDPEFITDMAMLPKGHPDIEKMFMSLLNDYGLGLGDIWMLDDAFAKLFGVDRFSVGNLDYDQKAGTFSAQFGWNITKRQFDGLWKLITQKRKKLNLPYGQHKLRGPEKPELLYAIFRARKRKEPFRRIFEKYQSGRLEGYLGKKVPTNQFTTPKDLENYYWKFYKPSL